MTIAECNEIWKKTKGNPDPDVKVLLKKIADRFQRYGYGEAISTRDFPQTTFHPLKIPTTVPEAIEKYVRDGDVAVDPAFVDLIDTVRKYNRDCNYENRMKELDEIGATEYVNFLHLAKRVIRDVPYRSETGPVRKGFRRLFGKPAEIPDKSQIVVITNPERDGLIDCFQEDLADAAIFCNRGLRVIYVGENQGEELRDLYWNFRVKDFDYVCAQFKDPSKAYSGIWTENGSAKVSFRGETYLFGLENDVNGKMNTGCRAKMNHEDMIRDFEKLRDE